MPNYIPSQLTPQPITLGQSVSVTSPVGHPSTLVTDGEVQLKTKSSPNSENLAMEVDKKESTFILKGTANRV